MSLYHNNNNSNNFFFLSGIITEVDGEGKDPLINKGTDIPMGAIDKKKLDKWEIERDTLKELATLGHGKMGRVYKANADMIRDDEKRTMVVVKEFNAVDDKEQVEEFNTEVEMCAQLDHANVVRLLGICTSKEEANVPWLLITDYGEEVNVINKLICFSYFLFLSRFVVFYKFYCSMYCCYHHPSLL